MVSATKVDTAPRKSSAEELEKTEGQNRMGESRKHPDFICPICGAKEFKEEYKSGGVSGFGSRSWRVHCVCVGCSVMFIDPEKFSKNRA